MRAAFKIKTFINRIHNILIVSPVNKVKKWDSLFKQMNIDGENPYRLFFYWLLDIFQYGFIIEFIRATIFGFTGWKTIINVIAFGMLYWLIFDMIKTGKNKLKEE